MNNINKILFLSLFFVVVFAKTSEYSVKKDISINNNGKTFMLKDSEYGQDQTRGEIDLFVENFDSGAEGWETGAGWQLSTAQYNSESYSMRSPNDASTYNNVWNLMSPTLELAALGEGETMGFTFYVYGDTPQPNQTDDPSTAEDESTYLADYYQVSIMDVDALAWNANSFNSLDGLSYWCGVEGLDNADYGYLDSWIQFLDTPSFTVPSGGTLNADLLWALEEPDGAVVAGTCTDGWDAANVRISVDGGENWDLLTPTGLGNGYDFDCGYGWLWNSNDYDTGGPLNDLAAGWGGQSSDLVGNNNGWVNRTFSLSQYAGQEAIVRFAFGSDPAYSTNDDSTITGFHVDNISVSGGALDCTPENECATTVDGAVWVDQFYDYFEADRPGYLAWEQYVAGMPFNGNVFMDISDFAGKNVTFRFQSRYDDGGTLGEGIFIDDFRIFKNAGCGVAPGGLTGEAQDSSANLSWDDMNGSGTEDFAFDDGSFAEANGITINGDAVGWVAEKFTFYGSSTINSVEVYSINTTPVDVQVGAFGALGTLFDTEPTHVISTTLQPGWNTLDVTWPMTTSFLLGYEFSSTITAGLDSSGASDNSYSRIGGGWTFWGDDATAAGLPQGDWGVRANVTYNSPNVTYNLYQDGLQVLSNLSDNSATVTGLDNNTTYSFSATANFDCGESDPSASAEVTPQPQTTIEVSNDDGSAESFFNAGSNNFTAVKFNAGTADLIRFKWLQEGDGGAFYLKMYEDAGGMPGAETYSRVLAGTLVDGWNTYDLSSEGITVSGPFWVGTREFSSTQPVGLDEDSNAGSSYTRVGASGDWTQVAGNLMLRVFVDGGEVSCGTGDTNGDSIVNVLDIVTTVNGVLAGGAVTDCANDMNGDGILNVLDIVSIVNIVLGG
jgi:hypothetical protein